MGPVPYELSWRNAHIHAYIPYIVPGYVSNIPRNHRYIDYTSQSYHTFNESPRPDCLHQMCHLQGAMRQEGEYLAGVHLLSHQCNI